jgi:hypothetical protein
MSESRSGSTALSRALSCPTAPRRWTSGTSPASEPDDSRLKQRVPRPGSTSNSERTSARYPWTFKTRSPAVKKQEIKSLLNWIGMAVGGPHRAAVKLSGSSSFCLCGSPIATSFGRSQKVDPLNAAFLNCMTFPGLDFDDSNWRPSFIRRDLSPSLFLPWPQTVESRGQFLTAYILGPERVPTAASRLSVASAIVLIIAAC